MADITKLDKPVFVLFMGGAGSGKSYAANKFFKGKLPILDIDIIIQKIGKGKYDRKNLSKGLQVTRKAIDTWIKKGKSFIQASTGANFKGTYNKFKLAKENGFSTIMVLVNVPMKHAIAQDLERMARGEKGLGKDLEWKVKKTYKGAIDTFNKLKSESVVDYMINYKVNKNINEEKELLLMGGNTRAIDRETGETIALAQKVDLQKVDRATFVKEMKVAFKKLNSLFKSRYKEPIWPDFKVITSGLAFNGSSEFLFDKGISDKEFVKYKPKVGDIDVTIPHEHLKPIFDLLASLENKKITNKLTYIGQNKKTQGGHQINALFKYKDGDAIAMAQVDFEGVEYKNNEPDEFAKFSHNSNWNDIKNNFKGVAHKFLLINLVRGISMRKDIVILTAKSPIDPNDKKFRVKKISGVPREMAFSVDRGLRTKLYQIFDENGDAVKVDNKFVFKEKPTADSEYKRDLPIIFTMLFKKKPSGSDLTSLKSFLGLITLMKTHLDSKLINRVFDQLVTINLFGPAAQKLDRDAARVDYKVKIAMVNRMYKEFSFLKKHKTNVKKLALNYYKNY